MSGRGPGTILVCAAVAAGLIAGGCGGGDADSTAAEQTTTTTPAQDSPPAEEPTGGGAAESTDEIEIADFKYDPDAITVDAGTEVVWTNGDEAAHTATADDGSFDTGTLELDDSGKAIFDDPGTYSYYCRFHPFMKATVEVQ